MIVVESIGWLSLATGIAMFDVRAALIVVGGLLVVASYIATKGGRS